VSSVAGAAACGGGEEGSTVPTLDGPAPLEVELIGYDMGYRPSTLVVAQGGTIVFVNEGQVIHDLRVEGEPRFLHEVGPGETTTVPVTLDTGTYEMFCSIPGHRAAGMEGTLVVG
jgi:plastocyanin